MIKVMKCSLCNQMKKTNLVILDRNICSGCEERLLNTCAGDQEYSQCMEGIKRILESLQLQKA
jgi:hypothetical protein